MSEILPPFPVDDIMLNAVEHALGGALESDSDGNLQLVGSDYSLSTLLDFLSGYNPEQVIPYEDEDLHTWDDVVEYIGGALYHEHDIIQALIDEVRRLRMKGFDR